MTASRRSSDVTVSIPAQALGSIFDDCDQYDHDETGGRIIGVFRGPPCGPLEIEVTGVIEAGPRANRSRSSFFQDGDYQAQVFRRIEASHPDVEHLGNWHTHHVNGFPTLSPGDIETYKRIVNHKEHNHNFFYALLVVSRSAGERNLSRYRIRHYILFRGDNSVYEIESPNVIVTQKPLVWPDGKDNRTTPGVCEHNDATRVKDDAVIPEVFPTFRPYWSKRASTFYWKGTLELVDGQSIEVMVPEMSGAAKDGPSHYQAIVKNAPETCTKECEEFGLREFESATQAVTILEKELNRALYRAVNQRNCE